MESSAKGTRRKRDRELGANDTRISMDASNLAPDLSSLAAFFVGLTAAIDKSDTLAQVPASLLGTAHTLQLNEASIGLLGVLAALVSQVASLDVQTI